MREFARMHKQNFELDVTPENSTGCGGADGYLRMFKRLMRSE